MSYQDFPPSRTPPGASPYTLTREEKRVLQECNSESFYRRCVPFMTVLGLGAYYGVHLGYLKKNINYGAAPKVTLGLVVGFIAGKLSFTHECEEKILRLPGGKLKESVLINRKRKGNPWQSMNDGGVYKDASISYAMPPYAERSFSSFEDSNPPVEIDVDRRFDSFDDSFSTRSEFADEIEQTLPNVTPSRSVSYDELREKNREEYENRRKQQYRSGPLDYYSPYSASDTPPPPQSKSDLDFQVERDRQTLYQDTEPTYSSNRTTPQRKNFYGDVIEK